MERASVGLIAVVMAAAAVLTGASPAGGPLVDVVLLAGFGALVAAGGAIAHRATVLLVGVAGLAGTLAVAAQYRDALALAVVAGVAVGLTLLWVVLLVAASGRRVFGFRAPRSAALALGALTAGLALQALLRLPPMGFFGLPSILAAVAVIPLLGSAAWRASRDGLRLSPLAAGLLFVALSLMPLPLIAYLGLTADRLRLDADNAIAELNLARTAAVDGDEAGFGEAVERARGHLAAADARLAHPAVQPAFVTPGVSQQVRAVRTLVEEADVLSRSLADSADLVDLGSLYTEAGWIDFDRVEEYREAVTAIGGVLETSTGRITSARSPWLVPPLRSAMDRMVAQLERAGDPVAGQSAALEVLPPLLGADGEQRILALLGAPAETREGGGFVGAYALLSARRDGLGIVASGPIAQLYPFTNELSNPDVFSGWYLNNDPSQFPQNLTASPNLTTTFEAVRQVFPQLEGAPVDSVLYIDPYGMGALVDSVGSIRLPTFDAGPDGAPNPLSGATLTGQEVVALTLRDQYLLLDSETQNDLMGDLFGAVLTQVLTGGLPAFDELDALRAAARGGHIGLASGDDDVNAALVDLGVLRAFPGQIDSDFVSIIQSNGAASKLDSYLERHIDYQVTLDPATGALSGVATVRLRSIAPEGLPQWLIGSYPDVRMGDGPEGHRVLVSVFTPHGVEQPLVNGAAVPSVRLQEYGLNRVLVDVEVPLRGETEVVFPVVGEVPAGAYGLRVFKQPLAIPDRLTVRVVDPSGQPIEPTNGSPIDSLTMLEDLNLTFTLPAGG